MFLSFNISPLQFKDPWLLGGLIAVASAASFPLRRLHLEITENALIENISETAAILQSIRRAGVSSTSQTRDLQVASVQLILEVVASKTAGGGVDFRVPFIGMKLRVGAQVTKKDTHTIDMTLVPPDLLGQYETRDGEIETVLAQHAAVKECVVLARADGIIR